MRTTVRHAINRSDFEMVAADYDYAGGEGHSGASPREVHAAACRGANARRRRAHVPAAVRPRPAAVRYDRPRVRLSHAPHPEVRVERARLGLATLAVTALVSAAVVCGLLGLAQLRAAAQVDSRTAVVQVHGAPSPGR